MYCLDTNIIIDLLRGSKEVIDKLETLESEDLFVAPITLFELFKVSDNEEEYKIIEELMSQFSILDFNIEVSKTFGKMFIKLKKIGKMIPEEDLMIASFVKYNNLIFLTRDKKHFENTDIKIEVW